MNVGKRIVVLVEGLSDQRALATLAARRGVTDVFTIVPMGGAHNIRRYLDMYRDAPVRVLCDAAEVRDVRRGIDWADHGELYVCDADLEDELIRALGIARVEAIFAAEGEFDTFRTMQKQPAQRLRPIDQQMRRFIGTKSGRKIRYGSLLVDALDLDHVPAPLDNALATSARVHE